jgi:hypothetical protein
LWSGESDGGGSAVNKVKVNEDAPFCERRNAMLGLGLLGTIIVVVLIVWIARRL